MQVKQLGTPPSPRSGHSIVTIGRNHYLFGGLSADEDSPPEVRNDLYMLKMAASTANPFQMEWKQLPATGEPPRPRSSHSAVKLNDDRIMIFGGFLDSKTRYNDCHVLVKVNTSPEWMQPPNQKQEGPPLNAPSKVGAPDPRGYHSATYHSGKVYIFGGHGGVDYRKIAFNDLFALDVATFEWTKMNPKGNPPEARGGHTASMMAEQEKIMFFGGWSFCSQFNNLVIYDIKADEWVEPEISHEISKWNMGAVLAPSIPSWKYFIFGGGCGNFYEGNNRTASRMVSDVYYLDVDPLEWVRVTP